MRRVDPRIREHLAPARALLAVVVAGAAVGGLLLVAQAFAVAHLITLAVEGADIDRLRSAGWWVVTVFTARALAGSGTDVAAAAAAGRVGTALRERLVDAALTVAGAGALEPTGARTGGGIGGTTVLVSRGVAAVEPYLTRYLPALVIAMVLPPATVVALATQDVPAAVTVAVTLPLIPVFAALVGVSTRDRAATQWRLLASLAGHFVDVVRGLPTLVAYDRATVQGARIREITDRYRAATLRTLRLAFASSAVLELVATLSVALVAVLVGLRLATGGLGLETALVVLLLAPEAYWPLRRVGAEFHAAAEGTATLEAADALLTRAEAVPVPGAGLTRSGVPGVTLRGVTVTYPGRVLPALNPVVARLEPRGLTAVVGPSGCGKSTLLAVLRGAQPPTAGEVLVDDPTAWPQQVAWVSQRPWILPGSVRANVQLGHPGAGDAQVWQALELVGLADHVATLPAGLDTMLAEDGATFSAGERARLALARVVVSNRPWVLVDEPTAHLDAETEAVVAQTLVRLADERAVVVVTHRTSLIAAADTVIALAGVHRAPTVPAGPPAAADAAAVTPALPLRSVTGPVAAAGATSAVTAEPPLPTPPARPGRDRSGTRLAVATLLGALASAAGVALTATAGWLIVRAAEQPPVWTLLAAIVAVRTFGIARPALRYAERLLGHDAVLHRLAEERAAVYDLLVPLVPGRLGPRRGDVLTSVVDDVDSLVDQQLRVRIPVWTAALVTGGVVGFAAVVAPAAAWVIGPGAAVAALAAVGVPWLSARRVERQAVAARALVSDRVGTMLEGAADLRTWSGAFVAGAGVRDASSLWASAARRTAAGAATGRAVPVLAAGIGVVAVLTAAGPAHASGSLSGPMLALLALIPMALAEALGALADVGPLAVRTRAARARLTALERLTPAVTDPVRPRSAPSGHRITVQDVSASWGTTAELIDPAGNGVPGRGEVLALTGVSMDVPPGGRVGVIGPSGSGKSTLVALLLRYLDPSCGRVTLDGSALGRFTLADVRASVGLVDDDPHVFASTLRENLRLAGPDATDDEVLAALDRAHLTAWVADLPDGLDTFLGDGHANISGGERARLAVARAVLGSRRVLVLDEPTAHLDTGTATALAADLLAGRDRSVVWVTHGRVGLDRMDTVLDLGARVAAPASSRAP